MQALILAGGAGTRLRPLTRTVAKPVIPLAGRPALSFVLDWLRGHGVEEVVLSCGFLSEGVRSVLGDLYAGMRLRYVIEPEPLGTAGPLRLAADEGLLEERFVILNGDVMTDLDLSAEIAEHERTGARATLALTEVEDTSGYGVVPTAPDGRVEEFIEKASGPPPTKRINAGAYVLERDVLELVPTGRAVSIEREVFPELIGDGLYGYAADGYWIDIGTPERYLEATWDLLGGRLDSTLAPRDETGSLIHDGCLTSGAQIGPQTVLGGHCAVGSDSTVERSVLHDHVIVGPDCHLREAVLAERVRLGAGCRVEPLAIVGAGADVGDGALIDAGARVEPDARIEPGARVEAGAEVGAGAP